MPAFRTSGSTGVAPNTVFFGKIPDQLTVLAPAVSGTTLAFPGQPNAAGLNLSSWSSVSLLNQFTPQKGSLGSTTTAPDGTTNAQHFTESADGSPQYHHLTAGFAQTMTNNAFAANKTIWRFAAFVKPLVRTRVALVVEAGGTNSNGIITVFDSAGGRVAVPQTVFNFSGTAWVPVADNIIKWPNGWYLCFIDFYMGSVGSLGCWAGVVLDAGSGTAAADYLYTGDGASGAYVWKSSLLPARAWGLNNIKYFNDFLNLSSFDLGRTSNPGFDFYFPGVNPGATPAWPCPSFNIGVGSALPNQLSITGGTVLNIPASAASNDVSNTALTAVIYSKGWNGSSAVGGFTVQPPCYLEISKNSAPSIANGFPPTTSPGGGTYSTFFTPLENLVSSGQIPFGAFAVEYDIAAYPGGGNFPYSTSDMGVFYGASEQPAGPISNPTIGVPLWTTAGGSLWSFQNIYVYYAGTLYFGGPSANSSTNPATDVAHWTPESAAVYNPAYPTALPPQVDLGALHNYGTLWLPNTPSDSGMTIQFFDGNYIPQGLTVYNYGLGVNSVGGFQRIDFAHNVLIIDGPTGPPSCQPMLMDFIRITGP
jgi:hypothetical protein